VIRDASSASPRSRTARSDKGRQAAEAPTGDRRPLRRMNRASIRLCADESCGAGSGTAHEACCGTSLNSCASRIRSAVALRPFKRIGAVPSSKTGRGVAAEKTRITKRCRPGFSGSGNTKISGSHGGSRRVWQPLATCVMASSGTPTTRSSAALSVIPTTIKPP
jgi:hypothetical protein